VPLRLHVPAEDRDRWPGDCTNTRKTVITSVEICFFRRIAEETSTNVRSRLINAQELYVLAEDGDHWSGDCTNTRSITIMEAGVGASAA
jgi:hypothetical protein